MDSLNNFAYKSSKVDITVSRFENCDGVNQGCDKYEPSHSRRERQSFLHVSIESNTNGIRMSFIVPEFSIEAEKVKSLLLGVLRELGILSDEDNSSLSVYHKDFNFSSLVSYLRKSDGTCRLHTPAIRRSELACSVGPIQLNSVIKLRKEGNNCSESSFEIYNVFGKEWEMKPTEVVDSECTAFRNITEALKGESISYHFSDDKNFSREGDQISIQDLLHNPAEANKVMWETYRKFKLVLGSIRSYLDPKDPWIPIIDEMVNYFSKDFVFGLVRSIQKMSSVLVEEDITAKLDYSGETAGIDKAWLDEVEKSYEILSKPNKE